MMAKTIKKIKSGRPRKSRRLRLNISSRWGGDTEFKPDDGDWKRIEDAYGVAVTMEQRKKIVGFVVDYFLFQPAETHAPYVDDAIGYLNRFEKAAEAFCEVLQENPNTPMTGSGIEAHIAEADRLRAVANTFVQSHLESYLKKQHYQGPMNWSGLNDVIAASLRAAKETREFILTESTKVGFVEGRSWDNLIWQLTEFVEKERLPRGVSKSDPAHASPFVRFVRELQATFPPEFRRHAASDVALTEAISVARRTTNRAIAGRKAKTAAAES